MCVKKMMNIGKEFSKLATFNYSAKSSIYSQSYKKSF